MFCTHRYYDPSTGRWLTRDPIGTAGGVNEYAYCGGNPVNGADPEGTDVYIMAWPGGGEYGSHAAIGVDWPGSKLPKAYDFGPAEEISAVAYAAGKSSHGEVLPGAFDPYNPKIPSHGDEQPAACVKIPTSPSQDRAIRSWLMTTEADDSNGWRGSYGRYNGITHQCSTYVNDALKAGGIDTGLGRMLFPIRPIFADPLDFIVGQSFANTNSAAVKPNELLNWAFLQRGAVATFGR